MRLNLDETPICLFQSTNQGNIFVGGGELGLLSAFLTRAAVPQEALKIKSLGQPLCILC